MTSVASSRQSQRSHRSSRTSRSRASQPNSARSTESSISLPKVTNSSKIPIRAKRSSIPVRSRGLLYCRHHPENEVTLVCEDCDAELVCVECVTSVHQRHGLVKLEDVAPIKRDHIQHYVDKAEKSALPKVKKQLKFANDKIVDNKGTFEDIINKIIKQGESFKQEIDKITETYVNTCKETEEVNYQKLFKYRKSLTEVFADLNLQIHDCKEVLQTGSVQQLHVMEKKIKRGLKMPNAPSIKALFFSPTSMDLKKIEEAVGILNMPDDESDDDEKTISSTVREFDAAGSGFFAKEDVSGILTMSEKVSRHITVVTEFKHNTDIHSMCPTNGNLVWILDIFSYEIFLLTRMGAVKETRDIKVYPDDLSISPVNGHMWLSSEDDYKIREIGVGSDKAPKIRFHSTDLPLCLCVTRDNKIMVGTHKTVTIYTPDGEVVQRSTTDRTRRQLVTFPRHLSQCAISGNIAVADGDDPEWGGEDQPHLVVMDSNLVLKFRYRGELATSLNLKKKHSTNFDPYDMCFDANGSILIADRTNKNVTLITHDGRYLGNVLTDHDRPMALALYNDFLWIGFDRGKVKVLKYLIN